MSALLNSVLHQLPYLCESSTLSSMLAILMGFGNRFVKLLFNGNCLIFILNMGDNRDIIGELCQLEATADPRCKPATTF